MDCLARRALERFKSRRKAAAHSSPLPFTLPTSHCQCSPHARRGAGITGHAGKRHLTSQSRIGQGNSNGRMGAIQGMESGELWLGHRNGNQAVGKHHHVPGLRATPGFPAGQRN